MSLPEDFINMQRARFDALPFMRSDRDDRSEVEAFFAALSSDVGVTSVRINPVKGAFLLDTGGGACVGSADKVEIAGVNVVGVVPWYALWGRYLERRPIFTTDPLFHGGAYYVQEASSMFVGWIAERLFPQGGVALDLCAAPGGKSTLLASIAAGRGGAVVANEVIKSRAKVLVENIQKWGTDNVAVTSSDASCFGAMGEMFDMVFVDAPCSGEGMFRKDERAVQEWSPDNVALCGARGRRIVSDVWDSLKVGGYMVYSTCTFNDIENEGNAQWMLDAFGAEVVGFSCLPSFPSFPSLIDAPSAADITGITGITDLTDISDLIEHYGVVASDVAGYRFYPHRLSGEGFYAVVIRKVSPGSDMSVGGSSYSKKRDRGARGNVMGGVTALQRRVLERYVESKLTFAVGGGQVYGFSDALFEIIERLRANTSLLYSGVCMGEFIRDDLKVSHSLALYGSLSREQIDVSVVDHTVALQYLRKGVLDSNGFVHGLSLVEYRGVALGWIKRIDTRVNNMYPQNWRILNY